MLIEVCSKSYTYILHEAEVTCENVKRVSKMLQAPHLDSPASPVPVFDRPVQT